MPPKRLTRAAERLLPAPIMRRLRVARFDRALTRYPRRTVEHFYAGVRHRVIIASEYGERYDIDWPELQEIAWLKQRRLQPGARVFDLGASYGVIAMMLADAVGPEGFVVALEAQPAVAEVLAEIQRMNDLPQLVTLNAAVARETGSLTFGRHGSVDDGTRRWGNQQVSAYSIDELARRHGKPDVVFIDVEGYELEALLGAPETLADGPDWFVEVHAPAMLAPYGATSEAVIACLTDAGYDVVVGLEAPYVRAADGSLVPRYALMPLRETPPRVLLGRFFALASRRPR